MRERLEYIDIAKGLGIILVVLSHSEDSDLMYFTSAFFVPIFFFCSGYTSTKKDISLSTFFRRQSVKLLKPYLFFSILLLLYFHDFSLRAIAGIFYSRYCLYPFNTGPDICHLMIVGNYPLWFLTCMIVTYLLYDLLLYYSKYRYWLICLYIATSIVATFLPILLPWSLDTAPLMAVIMYSGTITRKYYTFIGSRWGWGSIILYFLLLPFCHDINISVRMYGSSIITYLIAALSGCMASIYISRLIQGTIVGKGLQEIGIHSLTIFCIEIPFILIGKQLSILIIPNMPSSQAMVITSFIQLFIALAGGLLLSVLLHKKEHIRKIIF